MIDTSAFTTHKEIITTSQDTTSTNIVDTTAILPVILNPSAKTFTVLKPSKNKPTALGKPVNKSGLPIASWTNKPSTRKKSSTRSKLPTVLLIVFILCIIGLVLFLIFRFYKKWQHDNKSLLDRNNSDETYDSVVNESEIDPSTAISELSEMNKTRKGGRMLSRFNPDEL